MKISIPAITIALGALLGIAALAGGIASGSASDVDSTGGAEPQQFSLDGSTLDLPDAGLSPVPLPLPMTEPTR